eukprot:gene16929-biopygen6800
MCAGQHACGVCAPGQHACVLCSNLACPHLSSLPYPISATIAIFRIRLLEPRRESTALHPRARRSKGRSLPRADRAPCIHTRHGHGNMGGWMDEWMDGWMDGRKDGWMDGGMNEWMDGLMDRLMDGRNMRCTEIFEHM